MNKWIKRGIIAAASITVLFVVTLIIHIAMVIPDAPKNATANWQLGRIDFKQPLDSLSATAATRAIRKVEGITQTVVNKEDGNIVFAYTNNGDLDHDMVFEKFMSHGNFNASLYRPSKDELAASCPAINKSSVTYQLGSYFKDLFAAN